jgi:SAM-dependent methyltransferase
MTRCLATALSILLVCTALLARPVSGQPQPDALFITTPRPVVERMLMLADVQPDELVVDLGSGDGRIPIMAAERFGARGLGIEIDAELVDFSRRAAEYVGVADRVEFVEGDMFETDFGQADVLTLYLHTDLNVRLRPRILAMRPGTRVVSHDFDMDDWMPDRHEKVGARDLYLWIVPARVAGHWELRGPNEAISLTLGQRYQSVSGRARIDGQVRPLEEIHLEGRSIRFEIELGGETVRFLGTVEDDRITPAESCDKPHDFACSRPWQGVRTSDDTA